MRIPLIGVPDAPGPQQTFAPLSTTTYDKVGQAGAKLGETVEGVATDLPVRIKTALDQATLAKTEAHQEAFFQNHVDTQILSGPDADKPETYLQKWNDAKAGFTDQLSQDPGIKSLSIAARIQYQTDMAKFSAMTTQQVGHMATVKALANAEGSFETNYHQNLLVGNLDGAIESIKTAVATGAMDPVKGANLIFHAPAENEHNQVMKLAATDPITADKALQDPANYPHLVGSTRMEDTIRVHHDAQYRLMDNANDIRGRLDSSPNDPAVLADLREKMKTGQVTETAGNSMLRGLAIAARQQNAEYMRLSNEQKKASDEALASSEKSLAAITKGMAADYSWASSADPEGYARKLKEQVIGLTNVPLRIGVMDAIDNQLKAGKRAEASEGKPVEQEILDRIKEDRTNNGTFVPSVDVPATEGTTGWTFGTAQKAAPEHMEHIPGGLTALRNPNTFTDDQIKQKFGETATREHLLAVEQDHYYRTVGKMDDWFQQNPKQANETTSEYRDKAEAYRQSLVAPYVMEAVKQAITGEPTKAAEDPYAGARAWVATHQDDPRSKQILEKIGK